MAHHPRSSALIIARARAMRFNMTPTEEALWQELRGGKLGAAFRRQVPVGKYVADFLAASVKVVVEVDGGYHAQRRAADARRDRYFARLGYRVVRVEAELVRRDLAQAVKHVSAALGCYSSK
ncbi:MAG: DUF559 domain-containing protein [Polyangiaceae bacterium]|nr:DUF559 domain-containing protein [Polyangiaceae bacterium]